ncbi:hypothetical protein LSH36_519g03064 [Paralvinella palmiformis]|uniref:Uncharacterized protein n=1 Tax=Paralvinella palmiformis TaxID=53620 RepID=A0AAD9J838_9ANNE|nr:hypothetical protein LSH36_519g03064 [Paralvinella palmiformis]
MLIIALSVAGYDNNTDRKSSSRPTRQLARRMCRGFRTDPRLPHARRAARFADHRLRRSVTGAALVAIACRESITS